MMGLVEEANDRLVVAVCIATCSRPEGLAALLASLNTLVFSPEAIDLRIVVVDNDPSAPAAEALGSLQERSRWPLISAMEPARGVAAARNRCLDLVPADADYIAFVDDDEAVSPNWLKSLLTTLRAFGATAVQGPVTPQFERPAEAWIAENFLFTLGPFTEGQPLPYAAANNTLVDFSFLRRHRLRFDMRFNLSGGEDQEMFIRLRRAGGVIVASADAEVFDQVPLKRMTLRWILRRSYRIGNTLGRIAILHRCGRALRLAKGIGKVVLGSLCLAAYIVAGRGRQVAALQEIARGAGMIAAFVGQTYDEYRPRTCPAHLTRSREG